MIKIHINRIRLAGLFITILTVHSCMNNDEAKKSHTASKPIVEYFRIFVTSEKVDGSMGFSELMKMKKTIGADSTSFEYDVKKLHEGNDRLVIKEDKVFLNGFKCSLIDSKIFNIDNRNFPVDYYKMDYAYLYVNKELGILVVESFKSNVVELYYVDGTVEIPAMIINDKTFSTMYPDFYVDTKKEFSKRFPDLSGRPANTR